MKRAKRSKEIKSLEVFKKGFRKNEIVIYAIALMLVTAGYFNYTANIDKSVETSSENIITEKRDESNMENKNTVAVAKSMDENNEETQDDKDIGDAKLVNSDNVIKDDYYVSTKLQRDTTYADMISTYTKILQDSSIAETQKAIAMKEITKITDIKNAISVCENVLSTKGFENYLVLVNNDSVNVVIKVKGGLTKDKVAQIQNIVSREMGSKIENIHITEK